MKYCILVQHKGGAGGIAYFSTPQEANEHLEYLREMCPNSTFVKEIREGHVECTDGDL